MSKELIIASALATGATSFVVVYVVNPNNIFSGKVENILNDLYVENKDEFEKVKVNTINGSSEEDKDKEKKERDFLFNWADKRLCPVYEKKVKNRKGEMGDMYKDFFDSIENRCKKVENETDEQKQERSIGLKSIFYGLGDIKK